MIMNKVYELSGQMAQNKFDNSYFILKLKILDFFFVIILNMHAYIAICILYIRIYIKKEIY